VYAQHPLEARVRCDPCVQADPAVGLHHPDDGPIGAPLLLTVGVDTVLGLTEQRLVWFAGGLPVIA
jgi:hypothetical protein